MEKDWRPPHAYVPGVTPRHDEALFDSLKEDIDGTPYNLLHTTRAWGLGTAFLEEGYFWECHEVFEAIWMACPPNSAEKLFVQSIIQRANSGLKRKMNRENAAQRLETQAIQAEAEARSRKVEVFADPEVPNI